MFVDLTCARSSVFSTSGTFERPLEDPIRFILNEQTLQAKFDQFIRKLKLVLKNNASQHS